MRRKWLASFGPDKEIWILSEKGDAVLLLTRDRPNGDPCGRIPVFHVWKGEEWLYCGPSQQKADEVFYQAVKEG